MKRTVQQFLVVAALALVSGEVHADPLPSWNAGTAKQRIIQFVDSVTNPGKDGFVPAVRRIAVFDNDGTLWAEQPLYFQIFFALDGIAERAKSDPSILTSDVLKAAAGGDIEGALAGGVDGLLEIINASHSDVDLEEFETAAREWLATARNPETGQLYTEMVYQPMLELLLYLRDQGFLTYVVSAGGTDFMRAFAEDAYGISPQQLIGSLGNARYESGDGTPAIRKQTGIYFVDDGEAKPLAISRHIGVRPIFAGGNSDGDFEMLEWTTSGDGPGFGLLIHHTDGEREWAYDRESHVGQLNRGLDEGPDRGWLIVDMKKDWRIIYPESEQTANPEIGK